MLSFHQAPPPTGTPDGSRHVGLVAPFKGEPAPPEWLMAAAYGVAAVDTRHYLYEVYAGPKDQWLVRFLMLPEEGEALREIEQVLLFESNPKKKPKEINTSEIAFDIQSSTWKKTHFSLVDRRDLMKP